MSYWFSRFLLVVLCRQNDLLRSAKKKIVKMRNWYILIQLKIEITCISAIWKWMEFNEECWTQIEMQVHRREIFFLILTDIFIHFFSFWSEADEKEFIAFSYFLLSSLSHVFKWVFWHSNLKIIRKEHIFRRIFFLHNCVGCESIAFSCSWILYIFHRNLFSRSSFSFLTNQKKNKITTEISTNFRNISSRRTTRLFVISTLETLRYKVKFS